MQALRHLRLQRNLLLGLSTLLLLSNVLLVVLLGRQDTVTRLVPMIDAEWQVGTYFVNDAALKGHADVILQLLFSIKKENVDHISHTLLKRVDNAAYDAFKKQIAHFAEDVVMRDYRYSFEATDYRFDNRHFAAHVSGVLDVYFSGKLIQTAKKTFLLQFKNRGGVLMLEEFKEVSDAHPA